MVFEYLTISLCVLIAAMLVNALGFGSGMVAVTLLVSFDMLLADAVVLTSGVGIVSALVFLNRYKSQIIWSEMKWLISSKVVALPIGCFLLISANNFEKEEIMPYLGGIILLVIVIRFSFRQQLVDRLHYSWDIAAGGVSGFLSGLVGMGGPPIVLWLLAQKIDQTKGRIIIVLLYLVTLPFQIALLYFFFGNMVGKRLVDALLMTPVVYGGSLLGLYIGSKLSMRVFRILAWGFLFVIAVSTLT